MRTIILSLFFLSIITISLAQINPNSINIVVVSIDGPRYTESFGDSTHANVQFMYDLFSKQGTMFTNFKNNGVTATCPGHTAITTGVYQKLDNTGLELPDNPSVFQYWLKKEESSVSETHDFKVLRNKAWIITSKPKLEVLANTRDTLWKGKFTPRNNCGASRGVKRDDEQTQQVAKEVVLKHQPRLLLIQFKEPDISGHRNNWEAYLKGLQTSDSLTVDFWHFLQQQPTYKNNTIFLVTNDHGRHTKHFAHHGCDCNGCRQIFLLAIGENIPKGKIINEAYEQIDIPTTVSHWLNIEMPTSQGRVIQF